LILIALRLLNLFSAGLIDTNKNANTSKSTGDSKKFGESSRTGDPATGEFGDAQVIRKFGDVPTDLSTL
jgi:hypothetical protein